ncbi:MAG: hypothetical protein KDC18_10965 [Alphaproteobacteria bacterium]|nr:hypothetical protein [Alphaproteobacteria bacterium]MCB9927814.1 hypothetical protein [Alphaproteobacteria bacterium]
MRREAAKDRPDCAHLRFQLLRHTAVCEMADAGVSVPQIASVTGHTLQSVYSILSRYHRATAAQAEAAFKKRLRLE